MSNINLAKPNMTIVDGYFYMFDETSDVLFEVTADGTTAFSYPLDTAITNPIKSLEFDGINLWTLEEGATADEDIVIKRWLINNYVCKLQESFDLEGNLSHTYDSDAFTVEHYHTTVTGTVASGTYSVPITSGYDDKLGSGMYITLVNQDNLYSETLPITGITGGVITLNSPTTNAYTSNDHCHFYTDIWLFNNYNGTDTVGALYNINAYSGLVIEKYDGAVYKNIKSATFAKIDSFSATYGVVETLMYVKSSNLLFVNVTPSAGSLSYYGSMAMDNIAAGGGSAQTINDLAIDDNVASSANKNVYRLQTIDGNNYRLSTLNPIVSSIALDVYPAILPANGVSTASVNATVKDQFFQPVVGRDVTFQHNDEHGGSWVGSNTDLTDDEGKAAVVYKSGTEAADITVTAEVDQT